MSAGLYIHTPFCARICPYCDFAVATGKAADHERFANALVQEIEQQDQLLPGTFPTEDNSGDTRFDTIYLGGGTPSALEPEQLQQILEAVRAGLPVASDAQITLEANPEDVTNASAAAWHEAGVRRLSLGVQSLLDERLEFLGRAHAGAQARAAVETARSTGFDVVSIDLMFGAYGQSAAAWRSELHAAVALEPEHVSLYQLTYHQNTPFWRWLETGRRQELPNSDQADLYLAAVELLGDAGYEAYEVSNFARTGEFESRHNNKYWRHLPYLGLGPSAHSFDGRDRRWWNQREWRDWAATLEAGRSPVADSEALTSEQLATEAVMFGMRTRRGLDLSAAKAAWGIDLGKLNEARLALWREQGLVEGMSVIRPTPSGMAIADRLASSLRTS